MEQDRQGTSPPTLWSKLLVLFAASIITLVAFEGFFALVEILKPNAPIYPGELIPAQNDSVDAVIGWKMPMSKVVVGKTATYQSNSHGFRSSRDFDTEHDGRRIVFLGDSFTFGWGVEEKETFAVLLESKFENTRGYNFGIRGFGLDQMWMTLRYYALSVKPDLIILSFILEDLERSLSAYRWRSDWMQKPAFRLTEHQLVPITEKDRPNSVWRFVQMHSRLFELWRQVDWHLSRTYAIGYPWRLNKAIFAAIHDECRGVGTPLIVVYIPTKNGVRHLPMLEREFASMGIDFLDLSKLEPPNPASLYIENDGHLSTSGHRFVADAIFSFIKSRGLSPARDSV